MIDNLTVVVPFFNGHDTINALLSTIPTDAPVLIVDDISDEPVQFHHLERNENVRIIYADRKGYFSGAVNLGARNCETDFVVVNQDLEMVGERWLGVITDNRERYAVLGDAVIGHPAWPNGYVQGTFMFIRRDAWNEVGEFNERDYPLWGATAEWQARACRRGYEVLPFHKPEWIRHRRTGKRRHKFGESIRTMLKREPDKRQLFIRTPPLVSVIVPCYNYGRYLEDCINSFIGGKTSMGDVPEQTLASFEIIIVDDASTDGETRRIGASLEDRWKGIRHIQLQNNRGTPGCINAGIERAYGEYIHICSADDMREPHCLDAYYRTCQDHPHSFAYGDVTVVTNGERKRTLKMKREFNFDALLRGNYIPAGIMYPVEAWRDVGGYPEEMVYGREDWGLAVALGVRGWCGVHIGDAVNLYRREGLNRSYSTGNRHRGEATKRNAPDHWVKGEPPDGSKSWKLFFRNQIKARYPEIFRGERPMGCCGGRVTQGVKKVKTEPASLVGADGMAIIEYVGKNSADMTWVPESEPTNTRYRIGGVTRRKYVDVKHLEWFLSLRKNRKPLFQEYAPPKAEPVIEPEPKPEATEEEPAESVPVQEIEDVVDDLTVLDGVGPSTADSLRNAGFDTFDRLRYVSLNRLMEVDGISERKANAILEQLNDR